MITTETCRDHYQTAPPASPTAGLAALPAASVCVLPRPLWDRIEVFAAVRRVGGPSRVQRPLHSRGASHHRRRGERRSPPRGGAWCLVRACVRDDLPRREWIFGRCPPGEAGGGRPAVGAAPVRGRMADRHLGCHWEPYPLRQQHTEVVLPYAQHADERNRADGDDH
jgi:hypothetical protein